MAKFHWRGPPGRGVGFRDHLGVPSVSPTCVVNVPMVRWRDGAVRRVLAEILIEGRHTLDGGGGTTSHHRGLKPIPYDLESIP